MKVCTHAVEEERIKRLQFSPYYLMVDQLAMYDHMLQFLNALSILCSHRVNVFHFKM